MGTTRLLTILTGAALAAALAMPLAANATPSRAGACTSACHPKNAAVVVSAAETANNGLTAIYSVTVSPGGGSGWAVFQGGTRLTGSGGATGSFSVPVGAVYTVYGVAGGNDSNSVTIAPVATTPKTPTATSLRLSASRIVYGRSITATGAVTTSGTPLPRVPVTLYRMSGTTPVSVATTLTGVDGVYRFAVKPAAITTYRVAYSGDATYAASTTSSKVTVTAKVGTPSVPSYIRAYRTFTLRGAVSPNGKLTVRIYRYASGTMTLKKKVTVSSSAGVYKLSTSLPRGTYKAKATYVATTKIATATSAYRTFSVK